MTITSTNQPANPAAVDAPGALEHTPETDSRLAVARRIYAYIVTLISYQAALAGLSAVINILDQSWFAGWGIHMETTLHTANFGAFYRDTLAANGGLLLVAVPLFLLHWRYAQSLARRAPDEAGAGMRKFFLYIALATVMVYGLTAFYRLITGIGLLAVGGPLAESDIWPTGWFHAAAIIVLALALARYWIAILARDGDYGREEGMAGFWRRLYQTVAGLISLILLILGGSEVIRSFWQFFTGMTTSVAGDLWWRTQLINGLGILLIAGYLLRLNWAQWRTICRQHPEERSRGLFRFHLYGAVVIGALATLVPAAGLFEELLLIIFGVGTGELWALIDDLGGPVSFIPLGIAVWVWHWRYLQAEEMASPQTVESATVRRVYYYAVAATGLALLWFGAVEIVQALLDRIFVTTAVTSDYWLEGLARGLSLLAVGAPIWSFHWRAVERVARRTDEQGLAERASEPRRIYLYGVALVGALLILAFLAQVAYRGFLWALGDPEAGFFSPQAAGDLARSLIAAGLWLVHILAIRADGKMGIKWPKPTATEIAAEIGAPTTAEATRRAALESRIHRLESELAAARDELAAIPPDSAPETSEDATQNRPG